MSMRKKLDIFLPVQDVIVQMADGNIGALSTLAEIAKENVEDLYTAVMDFDDMNMRGSQIWAAYKYFADFDLTVLLEALRNRDQALVDKVNEICSDFTDTHKAVCSGAFFTHV